MSDQVAVESVTSPGIPATLHNGIPDSIDADEFVARLLVAGNNHHFLLLIRILIEPIPKLLLGGNLYSFQLRHGHGVSLLWVRR
ncbi:hypothetical protein [Hasllibacter sp. MH4015]|uniref:hypothetical protein n=1 Tax=Hasllibacter sp. MH4015 TaxID=2854029 RepID=UPI001CD26626|nr:hypothetical protein [Hasllibacter sp. MH4015]